MAKELTQLGPQHYAAIRLRIEGKNNDFIAQELGVSKETLYGWFGMPIVKNELARQMEKVNEVFAEKLVANSMRGLDKLAELLDEQVQGSIDAETMLALVREALDRNPATNPKLKTGGGGGNLFNFNFSNMSDDELREKAKELMSAVAGTATEKKPDGDDGD